MEKSTNRFKIFFILFVVAKFISIQYLLIIKMDKILKYKIRSKQKNNEKTKILFLEKISNSITLDEVLKTERAKYFINVG